MRLGYSITAHYRLIGSAEDVAAIVQGIITLDDKLGNIELSYHDDASMRMYSEGYRLCKDRLLDDASREISMHYLREGVSETNIDAINNHIKEVAREFNTRKITIHHEIFTKFARYFERDFGDFELLVENTDWREGYDREAIHDTWDNASIPAITLDVCHFDCLADLEDFLQRYGSRVREVQFAYLNHELPNKEGIQWVRERLSLVNTYIDTDGITCICEGTSKQSVNIPDLLERMRESTLLLKNICVNS